VLNSAANFDTSALDAGLWDWSAGLSLTDDGAGLIYLTGLVGGSQSFIAWDGGVGNWADSNWSTGQPPTPNTAMTIDAEGDDSVVTVAADFVSGGTGPAASVAVGETHTATLAVSSSVTLEVTGAVGVGEFGTLQVDGTLQAPVVNASGIVSGSGTITGDLTLDGGTVLPGGSLGTLTVGGNATVGNGATYVAEVQQEGTNDLLSVTGTLELSGEGDTLALEWLPGTDETSKFGGEYVVATAAEDQIVGNFDQVAGNIAAYLDVLDIDQGVGTGQAKLAVVLHDLLDGDATMDATVSLADLSVLGTNWLGLDKDWMEGDFTFDGTVSLADLSLLGGNWLQTAGGGGGGGGACMTLPATAGVSAVPEPGSLLMLLAAALSVAGLAWRRRKQCAWRCGR